MLGGRGAADAARRPRRHGRAVGGDGRRAVAGAVPVAAGAGLRLPGRLAAVAALAAGRVGGVRGLRGDRRAADRLPRARGSVRPRAEPAAGAHRRVGAAAVLGLLGRACCFAVRGRGGGPRALPGRRRAAAPPGAVAGLRRAADPALARRDVAARALRRADADIVTLTLLQAWPAVAVAIAVTRHGLYSIDRLVNRTLVYGALTALLVGRLRARRRCSPASSSAARR